MNNVNVLISAASVEHLRLFEPVSAGSDPYLTKS